MMDNCNINKNYIFMMMALSLFSLLIISCTKRFVGKDVDTNSPLWCKIYSLPAVCSSQDNVFIWQYSIKKGLDNNEYIFDGTADGSEGDAKSIGRIVPSKSNFYLILSNNDKIVDSIMFSLPAREVTSVIQFKRKFKCEMDFDAAIIYWEAQIRG